MPRQKITTFLWFDSQAEEAARFYASVFKDSHLDGATPGPDGKVLMVEFRLAGVPFMALNGGPHFTFNEAISLYVDCNDQAEVDALWEKLSEGGGQGRCGWLKDRYGLSWQIVPSVLGKLMSDPERGPRVMQALMQMDKLDIQKLQDAYDGR
jgi:predicted 3-demethylubiquinone-9 3-methyltransferase (glyoxalase superfamily)